MAREIIPKDILVREIHVPNRWKRFPLDVFYFVFWSFRICRGNHYRCFIGYDPPGLVVASILGFFCRVPVIYHSLELWCSNDIPSKCARFSWLPSQQMMLKHAERFFHKRVMLTIIQDKRRAKVLFEDNKLPLKDIYYVPHTGREALYKTQEKPDYLRQKFGINSEKSIILMVGGINETTLAYELAKVAKNWPSSWHLVLHGFSTPEYLDMISRTIDRGKITLSTDLVSMNELSKLIASSDVGLALYPNTNTNFYEMTSGKIGQYFRCGIPVIANNFPNLIDLVESSIAGLCLNSLGELPEAIENILKDYKKFSINAFKAYSTYYDFDKAFYPVYKRIEDI